MYTFQNDRNEQYLSNQKTLLCQLYLKWKKSYIEYSQIKTGCSKSSIRILSNPVISLINGFELFTLYKTENSIQYFSVVEK